MKIAIFGAGAYGTALGGILAENGHDIDYYDPKLKSEKLADVIENADAIVLCTPSSVVSHTLPHLMKDKLLIVVTKGILTDAIFKDFKDWVVLSGPGYADDIKAGKSTHLTATDSRIVELFSTGFLDFDMTSDRKGVLMCGALKNVYAIGAGLRGLKSGTEVHEQYLRDAMDEMRTLLLANRADPRTVDLNCGKGDLRITCYYPSRNYEFGRILKENPSAEPEKTVEGMAALKLIHQREIVVPENLKILEEIIDATER